MSRRMLGKVAGMRRQQFATTKLLLLPLPKATVDNLSLVSHLALATCRAGHGNRYQIFELARTIYLSYFIWEEGYGASDGDMYRAAEAMLDALSASAYSADVWALDSESAVLVEVVLRTFDDQLSFVPAGIYQKCSTRLARQLTAKIAERMERDL